MLLIGYKQIGKTYLAEKYKDKVVELNPDTFLQDKLNWPINYIEAIKSNLLQYVIVIIPYKIEIIKCLTALHIQYSLAYPKLDISTINEEDKNEYLFFYQASDEKFIIENSNLEKVLQPKFEWITIEEKKEVVEVKKPEEITDLVENNMSKDKLTLEHLVKEDPEITEADVRDLKSVQNKLKVGMLLQAKSSLSRVLKLSNVLDKLYDSLLDRIDEGLETTDTASLMYTTEYISKALHDTNQFIISLMSNDKIQNFFVIDNSSVVNINNDNMMDKDKRERIRKAVGIVMDNIDMFEQGNFENLKNPNVIDISEENIDGNTTT